jgi:SM-20-related protein
MNPMVSDIPLALNSELNRSALKDEYRRQGRIHIKNVLTEAAAERVYACLKSETAYDLTVNITGDARALRNLTSKEQHDCTVAAWGKVGVDGFQFVYDMHLLSFAGEAYRDPTHYWAKVTGFLNGTEFLEFAREITGIDAIDFADAQATLYRAGHFLTGHDDNVPGTKRLAAYVLSFTPVWRPEWGGLLEFLDSGGQVEAGYVPGFNTLKLFRVPMGHYVGMVAPYAQGGRYSITGWLRAR